MPLFKKRPLIVEAIRYETDRPYLVEAFLGYVLPKIGDSLQIQTGTKESETAELRPGDWLFLEKNIDETTSLVIKTHEEKEREYEPAVKKREPKVLMVEKKDLISQEQAKDLTAKPGEKK